MNALGNIMDSVRAWWQAATPAARAAATAGGIVAVVLLAVAGILAARPDYKVVASGVDAGAAASMKKTLDGHGIPMEFSTEDGAIRVPSKQASDALMYISADGTLGKDARIEGFETLGNLPMGISSELEKQRIRRANEGELARTLMGLSPVSFARVTTTPGDNSSLFSAATPASASVILTLRPGEMLSAAQTKGIVNLITFAVPGLSPDKIGLTDQNGTILFKDNGAGGNLLGGGQPTDQNAAFEEKMRTVLQAKLDSMLGPNKSDVTVHAELDFDQTSIDETTHAPANGAKTGTPISERTKEESYQGSGASAAGGGAAGASSNGLTSSYPSGGASGGGNFKSTDTTTNYDSDTKHTITQKTPGAPRQLSVAVMVDAGVPKSSLDALRPYLMAAIGATSGDTTRAVDIQQIPFSTAAQTLAATQAKAAMSAQLMSNIVRGVAVALVVGVLLFALLKAGGGARVAGPQVALAGGGANIGMLERAQDDELGAIVEERPLRIEDVLAEMPDAEPHVRRPRRRNAPSIEEQQNLKMESIQNMISSSPESVALLLKGWMVE